MSRGMIPADLFRIQWVTDACIAPDGRLIACTVTRLDEEADIPKEDLIEVGAP